MTKNLNRYLYKLIPYEGSPIIDTVDVEDLMQAFNMIDGEFGLSSQLFKNISIELLRRNV